MNRPRFPEGLCAPVSRLRATRTPSSRNSLGYGPGTATSFQPAHQAKPAHKCRLIVQQTLVPPIEVVQYFRLASASRSLSDEELIKRAGRLPGKEHVAAELRNSVLAAKRLDVGAV